jgi:putative membrane protein
MMGYSGMGLLWLWPLLIIAGLAVLSYVVAHARPERFADQETGDEARRILGERFASGEIDDEEYRRRRDSLR